MHDNLPFTNKELAFLKELTRQKVEFMVIGLSAAALQGAPMVTQDVDLWFRDLDDSGIKKALKKVGGTWIPSLALNPPMFEGDHVQYFDIVLTVHGIGDFDAEKANTVDVPLGGFSVKVLRLDRIIASKSCLNREKDRMVLPALKSAAKALIAKQPGGAKRGKKIHAVTGAARGVRSCSNRRVAGSAPRKMPPRRRLLQKTMSA